MPRRKVTEEVLERMKKLREEGLTYREIADKLNLSYETVFRYLREEGFFETLRRKMSLK
ncbi:hypothetical protein ES706_01240 [subsurface metagenome]|nr:helix-turn-helix domain-containing protein [Hadesarchaea archaeon]